VCDLRKGISPDEKGWYHRPVLISREATVPYIEVKAVDRRFEDPESVKKLIAALTDAACEIFGEEARSQIWVVVEGVPASRFGVGGEPLG
jgi:4-oxalocrotonate tautomerase